MVGSRMIYPRRFALGHTWCVRLVGYADPVVKWVLQMRSDLEEAGADYFETTYCGADGPNAIGVAFYIAHTVVQTPRADALLPQPPTVAIFPVNSVPYAK